MLDFYAIDAKIARAERHIDELQDHVMGYLRTEPCTFVGEFQPETSEYVFFGKVLRHPPVVIGIVIGDIAHNLRSALDHLAWQLALEGGKPTKITAFPITNSQECFDGKRCQKSLNTIPRRFHSRINACQPYKRWDVEQANPRGLLALRELSNTDKHRVLNATPATLELSEGGKFDLQLVRDATGYGNVQQSFGGPIDGAEIMRLELVGCGPHPEVQMKFDLAFNVAIEHAHLALRWREVGNVVNEAVAAVKHVVSVFRMS